MNINYGLTVWVNTDWKKWNNNKSENIKKKFFSVFKNKISVLKPI
jgi:hypothetical protein